MSLQGHIERIAHRTGCSVSIKRWSRVASERALYWLGRTAVAGFMHTALDLDVAWHAPLPKGPKILAANHPTTTDPFFILALAPEQISVLVTGMCFEVPVFGRYLRAAGHVPVVHSSGGRTARAAIRLLRAGRTVAIFPEGALSPLDVGGGGLGFYEPHAGVARMALGTGAPVIPVGIHVRREGIRFAEIEFEGEPVTARWYVRGPYAITVGEPMTFGGDVEDWAQVRSVSEHIMQRIIHLSRESGLRMQQSPVCETGSIMRPVGVAR
jgi:1-acyl-sn-glycerol-3-phosphate acyltransferase